MNTTIDIQGDRMVVALHGRLDASSAPAVEAQLVTDGIRELVLDFADCPFVSSCGIRTVLGGAKALPEVTASHTLYLEELGLKPGDFVSYYAKAADNDGVDDELRISLRVMITYDFKMELRMYGDSVKVVRPEGLLGEL